MFCLSIFCKRFFLRLSDFIKNIHKNLDFIKEYFKIYFRESEFHKEYFKEFCKEFCKEFEFITNILKNKILENKILTPETKFLELYFVKKLYSMIH